MADLNVSCSNEEFYKALQMQTTYSKLVHNWFHGSQAAPVNKITSHSASLTFWLRVFNEQANDGIFIVV